MWQCTNKEYATMYTLHMLIGMLKATQEGYPDINIAGQESININCVLRYINEHIEEQTQRLNALYPDRAEF